MSIDQQADIIYTGIERVAHRLRGLSVYDAAIAIGANDTLARHAARNAPPWVRHILATGR